jgi:hypothetical protein
MPPPCLSRYSGVSDQWKLDSYYSLYKRLQFGNLILAIFRYMPLVGDQTAALVYVGVGFKMKLRIPTSA